LDRRLNKELSYLTYNNIFWVTPRMKTANMEKGTGKPNTREMLHGKSTTTA
jgi:hypothetical protein